MMSNFHIKVKELHITMPRKVKECLDNWILTGGGTNLNDAFDFVGGNVAIWLCIYSLIYEWRDVWDTVIELH